MTSAVVPVILSGGAGTRLWPLSTEDRPKQFLRIWPGGRSLLQQTLLRVRDDRLLAPVVVCNAAQRDLVEADAREAGIEIGALILEPMRKDSAGAVAAAAAWALDARGPGTVLAILASDHLIGDTEGFLRCLRRAASAAGTGRLVTFGIRPDRPATEFGYVERGEALAGLEGVFRAARFHEKPTLEVARSYLDAGRFDWNSGMLVTSAGAFAEEAERHAPALWETVREAVARGRRDGRALRLDEEAFSRLERISIDYALLEKSDRVAVLPADFDWSDVGNWSTVREALGPDADGNARQGDARLTEGSGNLVLADGVPVRVIGVDGLAVVAGPNGVLVMPLDKAAQLNALLRQTA